MTVGRIKYITGLYPKEFIKTIGRFIEGDFDIKNSPDKTNLLKDISGELYNQIECTSSFLADVFHQKFGANYDEIYNALTKGAGVSSYEAINALEKANVKNLNDITQLGGERNVHIGLPDQIDSLEKCLFDSMNDIKSVTQYGPLTRKVPYETLVQNVMLQK